MPTNHHTLTTPLPRVAALEHNSYPATTADIRHNTINPPLNASDPFFRALDATLATEARAGALTSLSPEERVPPLTPVRSSASDGRNSFVAPSVANEWDLLHNQRKLLRDIRLRDMLAAIEEFWHASGTERRWWRKHARWQIKIFRENHLIPEAAAFRAAVERSRVARRPGP